MIELKVNGVDKTSMVEWESLTKTEVLTKEPDTLKFRIKNYGAKTYRPILGDEITLFYNSVKIFGGVVVDTTEAVNAMVKYFDISATKDFTHTLDRKLVANTYTATSVNDIIADLIDNFTDLSDGFTYTNVDCTVILDSIVFNYITVSECLKKLQQTLGNYDWFVDYDKDIHFFETSSQPAPFNLNDTSGNFIWNSLVIQENINQLRNHIIIRGGDVEGDSVSNNQIADGSQRVFFIGYSLTLPSLVIEQSLAITPTVFFTLSVGKDGVDNPLSFDTLYNPDNGLLIFRDNNKPAVSDHLKTTGVPVFPLLSEKKDIVSIGTYGTYQYLILDKTIRSRASASQRSQAELVKYSKISRYAKFRTNNDGLKVGHYININSAIRGVNQSFLIDRITTRLRTPDTLEFDVSCLASEDVTMIDILNKLVTTDPTNQINIGSNEIVDTLNSALEAIDLNEFLSTAQHHDKPYTLDLDETEVVQPLDYGILWVLGPYTPVIIYNGIDNKRAFIVNGSYLS